MFTSHNNKISHLINKVIFKLKSGNLTKRRCNKTAKYKAYLKYHASPPNVLLTSSLSLSLSVFSHTLPILCVTVSLPGYIFLSSGLLRLLLFYQRGAAVLSTPSAHTHTDPSALWLMFLHQSLITFRANCHIWRRMKRKTQMFSV